MAEEDDFLFFSDDDSEEPPKKQAKLDEDTQLLTEQDEQDVPVDLDEPERSYGDDGVPDPEKEKELIKQQIEADSQKVLNINNTILKNSNFFLTMEDCKNFKNFVNAVENLVRECKWRIHKDDNFQGITTYSANEERTCFLLAYFTCNVTRVIKPGDWICGCKDFNEAKSKTCSGCGKSKGATAVDAYSEGCDEFTIYMDVLKKLLKPIESDSCIGFYNEMYKDEIEIYGINPYTLNFSYDCSMKMLDTDMEDFTVKPEIVFRFCLQVETKKLSDIMQWAIDNSADSFTIYIEEATLDGDGGEKEQRWNRITIQIIGSHTEQRFRFYSLTEMTKNPIVDEHSKQRCMMQMELNTNTSISNWPKEKSTEVYRDTFNTKLFRNFLRSIMQPRVSLYIDKGYPMVIYTAYGKEGNRIYSFIEPMYKPE